MIIRYVIETDLGFYQNERKGSHTRLALQFAEPHGVIFTGEINQAKMWKRKQDAITRANRDYRRINSVYSLKDINPRVKEIRIPLESATIEVVS